MNGLEYLGMYLIALGCMRILVATIVIVKKKIK